MAVFTARGAPLPDRSALVAEPQWQQLVQQSLTLTEKILQGIEDTHKFYVIVKVCRTLLAGCPAAFSFPAAAQRSADPVSKKSFFRDPAS